MAENVTMTHPDLPGEEIDVHPGGVAVRERSGWQRKSAPSKAAKAAPKTAPGKGTPPATSGTTAAPAAESQEN